MNEQPSSMDAPPPRPTRRPTRQTEGSVEPKSLAPGFGFDVTESGEHASGPRASIAQTNAEQIEPPATSSRLIRIQPAEPDAPHVTAKSDLLQNLEAMDVDGAINDPEAVKQFKEVKTALDKEGPGGPTARDLRLPVFGVGPQICIPETKKEQLETNTEPKPTVAEAPQKLVMRPRRFESRNSSESEIKPVQTEAKEVKAEESTKRAPPPRPTKRSTFGSENSRTKHDRPDVSGTEEIEHFDSTESKMLPTDKPATIKSEPLKELTFKDTAAMNVSSAKHEELEADVKESVNTAESVEFSEPVTMKSKELSETSMKKIDEPVKSDDFEKPATDLKKVTTVKDHFEDTANDLNKDKTKVSKVKESVSTVSKDTKVPEKVLEKPVQRDLNAEEPIVSEESSKESSKVESKESSKDESRESSNVESKDESKESKDDSKESKGESKEPKDESMEPKDESKEPKDESKESKDESDVKVENPLPKKPARTNSDIDPKDASFPSRPEKRPEKPLAPKPKSALASRFEAALRENEAPKPKPVPKSKPRLGGTGRVATMQASMFADLNAALSRGPPPVGRSRMGSSESEGDASRRSSASSDRSGDMSVDANESADVQISAMPKTARARTSGPRNKRLPESAKPRFSIVAPSEPIWGIKFVKGNNIKSKITDKHSHPISAEKPVDNLVNKPIVCESVKDEDESIRPVRPASRPPRPDKSASTTEQEVQHLVAEVEEALHAQEKVELDKIQQDDENSTSLNADTESKLRTELKKSLSIDNSESSNFQQGGNDPTMGIKLPSLRSLVDTVSSPPLPLVEDEIANTPSNSSVEHIIAFSLDDELTASTPITEKLQSNLKTYLDKSPGRLTPRLSNKVDSKDDDVYFNLAKSGLTVAKNNYEVDADVHRFKEGHQEELHEIAG